VFVFVLLVKYCNQLCMFVYLAYVVASRIHVVVASRIHGVIAVDTMIILCRQCDWLLNHDKSCTESVSSNSVEDGLDPESSVYKAIMSNDVIQLALMSPRTLTGKELSCCSIGLTGCWKWLLTSGCSSVPLRS
jgi:hypothetical protein